MNFNLINRDPGFISSHLLNDYGPGEHKFITGDDIQRFEECLKNSPKDWYYRNHEVKYVLNSNRFIAVVTAPNINTILANHFIYQSNPIDIFSCTIFETPGLFEILHAIHLPLLDHF